MDNYVKSIFIQGTAGEQNLIQDLINEQLRMYGVEVHYMPRSFITENSVIREVIESSFESAYPIEAYIQNYEGYADNPVLLSKFGIEQTQELTFCYLKERWENYIEPLVRDKPDVRLTSRPKEGDLVYLPFGDRLYEIKYVEHEKPFYQLQKNYVYELRCELFRYDFDEVIDIGVMEIDDNLLGNETDGYDYDGNSTMLGPTQTMGVSGVGVCKCNNGYCRWRNSIRKYYKSWRRIFGSLQLLDSHLLQQEELLVLQQQE